MDKLDLLKVNWKLALSTFTADASIILAALAALPYSLGDMATVIPPDWKPWIVKVSLIAAALMKLLNFVLRLLQLPVPSLPQNMQPTPANPVPAPQPEK